MKTTKPHFFYPITASIINFLFFVFFRRTAYDWPAKDMFPFFERLQNPDFVPQDFFTNATSIEPNPRWIFGFFIEAIRQLVYLPYYDTLFLVKTVLVVLLPILLYLFVYTVASHFIDDTKIKKSQPVILLAVLLVLHPKIAGIFAIAWWPPITLQVVPSSISTLLGLTGLIIGLRSPNARAFGLMVFFLSLASLMHPTCGIMMSVLYIMINTAMMSLQQYKKNIVVMLVGGILPSLLVMLLFKSDVSLPTTEFIDIYALHHAPHYHLEDFGTTTRFSWVYSYVLIMILFLIPMIIYVKQKQKKLICLAILFALSYNMAIALQYVFIDIFPSKIIATIGPSRSTMWGYWMCVILWVPIAGNIRYVNTLTSSMASHISKYITLSRGRSILLSICILIIMIVIGFVLRDNPKIDKYAANKDFYDFIAQTPRDAAFAASTDQLNIDILLIGERPVFAGNGFPFNEKYFKEHQARHIMLHGYFPVVKNMPTYKGKWIGEVQLNYYRSLKPENFMAMSKTYKLDYVIIEADYSEQFKNYAPVYKNNDIHVYKVADFELLDNNLNKTN